MFVHVVVNGVVVRARVRILSVCVAYNRVERYGYAVVSERVR